MNRNFIWFGRYEGWLASLAKGVKTDEQCVKKAAVLFDLMLPDRCVVVPMPTHTGGIGYMSRVAHEIPGDRYIMDALTSDPHESSYESKRSGLAPQSFDMRFDPTEFKDIPQAVFDGGVYVIDNVVCTGTTASCAIRAIQDEAGLDAKVVALAYSPWR